MANNAQLSHTAHKILADIQRTPIKVNNGHRNVIQFTMEISQWNTLINLLEEVENLGVEEVEYHRVKII